MQCYRFRAPTLVTPPVLLVSCLIDFYTEMMILGTEYGCILFSQVPMAVAKFLRWWDRWKFPDCYVWLVLFTNSKFYGKFPDDFYFINLEKYVIFLKSYNSEFLNVKWMQYWLLWLPVLLPFLPWNFDVRSELFEEEFLF